jgi:hypothetical protein
MENLEDTRPGIEIDVEVRINYFFLDKIMLWLRIKIIGYYLQIVLPNVSCR